MIKIDRNGIDWSIEVEIFTALSVRLFKNSYIMASRGITNNKSKWGVFFR